jgi:hypothetical protein
MYLYIVISLARGFPTYFTHVHISYIVVFGSLEYKLLYSLTWHRSKFRAPHAQLVPTTSSTSSSFIFLTIVADFFVFPTVDSGHHRPLHVVVRRFPQDLCHGVVCLRPRCTILSCTCALTHRRSGPISGLCHRRHPLSPLVAATARVTVARVSRGRVPFCLRRACPLVWSSVVLRSRSVDRTVSIDVKKKERDACILGLCCDSSMLDDL